MFTSGFRSASLFTFISPHQPPNTNLNYNNYSLFVKVTVWNSTEIKQGDVCGNRNYCVVYLSATTPFLKTQSLSMWVNLFGLITICYISLKVIENLEDCVRTKMELAIR